MWEHFIDSLQKETSNHGIRMWLKSTRLLSSSPNHLEIGVPTSFLKEYLDNHYKSWLEKRLKEKEGREVSISFVVSPLEDQKEMDLPKEDVVVQEIGSSLNPKYTFENFVVGGSNRFAHAACLAVAKSPAKIYNPLFIYGGVGLGKTHLLHAIAHYCRKIHPQKKTCYISSERFVNEFIESIKYGRSESFKNRYRGVDLLLVDDIQFLAGKVETQVEFFHTFNTLHESHHQVVISSDCPPKEIPALEERLRSRFESGLITDIQPPDLETRIAILKKKVEYEGIDVPEDVLDFIASRIRYNIRELEGALIRIVAFASFDNKKIDITLAKEILKDVFIEEEPPAVSIETIQRRVAKHFKVQLSDLKSKKRTEDITLPRQVAMYLARELTDLSYPGIGERFGGKDHATVIHAHKKIEERIKKDEIFKGMIERLIEELKRSS